MTKRACLLFYSLLFFFLSMTRASDLTTPSCNFGDCPPILLFRACADGSPGYKCVLQGGQCVAQTTDCPISATPCSNDSDCSSNHFCYKTTCQNDTGVCRYVYDVCTAIYAPVCGCDGKTYASQCEAQRAHVNVQYDGTCDGSSCTDNSQCRSTSFCSKSSGCDSAGTCQPRPDICFDLESPVCGCDGKTYPNSCYAERNGVVVKQTGDCPANQTQCTPQSCGPRPGLASRLCPDNVTVEGYTDRCLPSSDGTSCAWEYISCPAQTECKFADCTPLETFRACADGSPGYICVRDSSSGKCVAQATDCPVYCTTNSQCAAGSFCSKPTCDAQQGKCEKYQGFFCTAIYDPVCGCDGKTYSSACNAKLNQQNVAYVGECGVTSRPTNFKVCMDKAECGLGSFCFKSGCRSVYGKCTPLVNTRCSGASAPVCGCDNVIYTSSCQAIQAGVNINIDINACRSRSKRSGR